LSQLGKATVFVKSRKVPVGVVTVHRPVYSSHGVLAGVDSRQVVIYDTRLDPSHLRAVEEARRLSRDLGMELKVVDLSSSNPIMRLVSALAGRGARNPSLILSPALANDDSGRPGRTISQVA
jgi:electron transfer flavoprotein alpha/beta subunit